MKKTIITILLFISSLQYSQVIDIERGKLEIIGLKSISPQSIVDSLSVLYPGKPIHACAASMTDDFGFAKVSSILYPMENRKYYYVVTIIENDSANRISNLDEPKDQLETLEEYKSIEEIVNNRKIYLPGLLRYYRIQKEGYLDSSKTIAEQYRLDTKIAEDFCQFLKEHKAIEDLNLALWLLNNDSNVTNDKIALAILTNFDAHDVVWWTLMDLQRRKNNKIALISMEILRLFMEVPRNINWEPVLPGIRSILAGTNLFAYWSTLELLVKTNISPKLANQLLKDNKELLSAYLSAQHEQTRDLAVQFVKHMSNNFISADPSECKKWLLEL